MFIKKIETFVLRAPLGKERFYSSQCAFPERNSLLVRIETDNGIIGWGEGGQYGPPEPVASCIQNVLKPIIMNKDPREIAVHWNSMYVNTRDFGQKGTYIEAISAIDIALWDITGQSLGVPVNMLLGGAFREGVTAYATGCYYRGSDYLDVESNIDKLQEEAIRYKDSGFKMLKVKIGLLKIEDDIKRIKAIRNAIGPEVQLLVDCNHAYNSFNAIRIGKELEKLGVVFMEEPVTPEDYNGYIQVHNHLNLAIAGGEAEYTRFGFEQFISRGCVDIIQPDITVCGGLSEWLKILAIAQSRGVMAIPHVWGSGIALAAALHATVNIPCFPHTANPIPLQNEPVIEFDKNPNPLRDLLLNEKIKFEDGKLFVPKKPGLGISVNEDVLREYSK